VSPRDTALRALPLLDLTDLNDGTTEAATKALCEKAARPVAAMPDLHVAATCVWPRFVKAAKAALGAAPVKIATVANFPSGAEPGDTVAATVRQALADGADEIDLVLDHAAFRRGETRACGEAIAAVKALLSPRHRLKVILETGELGDAGTIRAAARLAAAAGADTLKTSTGKVKVSATPEAMRILMETIAESARPMGVKPSGGIRTTADAAAYLAIADEIMGPAWASPATFRFGASGLLDDLVATILGGPAAAPKAGY
jgi:deoxyribose-phosphate aldolase